MRRDIIVVENFYDNPQAVIDYARNINYYYPYENSKAVAAGEIQPSWKTSWMTPSSLCPFRSSENLIQKLETLTGEVIDKEYWHRDVTIPPHLTPETFYGNFTNHEETVVNPNHTHPEYNPFKEGVALWNCAFQIKLGGNQSQGIHHHISDYWHPVGEHGWNGIVYLNENAPLRTGIKFWKHKQGNNNEWMTPHDRWDMVDEMGNVFNRLILFRGDLPHSGSNGFGKAVDDGRLFQLFFFKTISPAITDSVSIKLDNSH